MINLIKYNVPYMDFTETFRHESQHQSGDLFNQVAAQRYSSLFLRKEKEEIIIWNTLLHK